MGITTALTTLTILFGAALFTTLQSLRASRAAERERQRAEQVTGFLSSMLELAEPSIEHGPELLMRDVLALAGERIDSDLADQPRARWSLHDTIAKAYWELGLYDDSALHFERSLAIVRELDASGQLGPDESCALPAVLDNYSFALIAGQRGSEAASVLREAAGYYLGHPELAPFMPAITDLLMARALRLCGQLEEAERHARSGLAVYIASWGADSPSVAGAHAALAEILRAQGRLDEATREAQRALTIHQEHDGGGSLELARARTLAASLCVDRGAHDDARPLLESALSDLGRVLPPEHPDLTRARELLASLDRESLGKAEARQHIRLGADWQD